MWGLLLSIAMAILIGIIGDALVRSRMPGGVFGSMIAGFAGAWLGILLLGAWGPVIAGFPIIPSIIGSALFVFLLGMLGQALRKAA
ncbi:GlsB/YeaQ/YmgE family stress response membrane protein [Cohnella thailandensis]|uniref:GlsB/YeaQ/YmgE family stress response membrane protein n=1 Tax=Cohnella thailandensis TaxID=557557 RepID=A0A841T7N7_9BACL|nr:GlsB/YeaQ/YmgE family stress response membrane protein [Cohnella thailandensis]MBB6637867.1 GlsB/YeaQ/YmgE family stress response membrane protein [Cohnella thailandensis]MBP1977425.1 putative membrane protein YeaQ/YmgE (transglycosylase-associated protein family) [Cohnella thailandensis]